MGNFRHRKGRPLFDFVHPAFPLPTTSSPTVQGALDDSFGEAVVARNMPEPCEFLSLDSSQTRFLWAYKIVDHAPQPVVWLVLQEGGAEKFLQALGLESLDPFLRVNKHGPTVPVCVKNLISFNF